MPCPANLLGFVLPLPATLCTRVPRTTIAAVRDQPSLPNRRSIRLRTFDYSQPSAYFLTICARENKSMFGRIIDGKMVSNALGRIVENCWREILIHFPNVELATHVIMPNHMHGIIVIRQTMTPRTTGDHGKSSAKDSRRAQHAVPLPTHGFGAPVAGSIPTVVGAFKSSSAKQIRQVMRKPELQVWQRGYYEHVIRNDDDFRKARAYIRSNPARWAFDRESNPW
jgi:putative transposase